MSKVQSPKSKVPGARASITRSADIPVRSMHRTKRDLPPFSLSSHSNAAADRNVRAPTPVRESRCARASIFLSLLALVGLLCGCATSHETSTASTRRFDFQRDTFAFPNELRWEYFYDASEKW